MGCGERTNAPFGVRKTVAPFRGLPAVAAIALHGACRLWGSRVFELDTHDALVTALGLAVLADPPGRQSWSF